MLTETVKSKIIETLQEILSLRKKQLPQITQDTLLIGDLHMDSLEMAQLVSILEFEMGVDPFATNVAITSIRSVGDLCAAYEKCH